MINVPSAASAYSPIAGDENFLEIWYLLTRGVVAFLQQVSYVRYHMSEGVNIFLKRLLCNFR